MSLTESQALRRIDFSKKEFTGKSGTVYRIESDEISVGRFQIYERKALELGFGVDFKALFESFSKVYKHATTGDSTLNALHQIAQVCLAQMQKMKEGNTHSDDLMFCTLFCNAPDEDRTAWDVANAEAKCRDWAQYDMRDFFLLSRIGIEGYSNALHHTEQLPDYHPEPPKKVKKKA